MIYISLDIVLIVIRINCNNAYELLFGIDGFFKLNLKLIWLNFSELFLIILIYVFLIMIFYCSFNSICSCCKEFTSFFCCCFYCNCSECKYEIKQFFSSICQKDEQNNNNDINKSKEIIINNIDDIKNREFPLPNEIKDININNINDIQNRELPGLNSEETRIKDNSNNISFNDKGSSHPRMLYNPIGKNAEMYKRDILKGQKILIVMTLYEGACNIPKLYNNGNNKTVKEAVEHFGITIVAVNNYKDAIKELKKNDKGKCPYYACWLINNKEEKENMKEFLRILHIFWKSGGAVVLFSDNVPFVLETNQFLSMINAGFIMDGNYIGQKYIYGDNSGELNKEGVFNRNEDDFAFGIIPRQKLSHNLYKIYEGDTISSVTKNGKRCLDVKNNDIYPFVIFARDSEGGITSLFKPANEEEGDLIIDGGFTKLFLNMKEDGTFRYVQNLAGFTAKPEVHFEYNINPKDYRPKCIK